MLQANTASDPIVQILRLAYRRGLLILQEQEEASEAADVRSLEEDARKAEMRIQRSEIQATKKVKGGE